MLDGVPEVKSVIAAVVVSLIVLAIPGPCVTIYQLPVISRSRYILKNCSNATLCTHPGHWYP